MDTAALVASIDEVSTALQQALSAFSTEQLNTIPFEGSWTAGQVAEHIQLSVNADILYGKVEKRAAQEDKLEGLRKVFLDFGIKMKSPDFILPSNRHQEKEALLADLRERWQRIREAAQILDLSLTCLDFEIPGVGYLTRYELIGFFAVHTARHVHQLHKIQPYVIK